MACSLSMSSRPTFRFGIGLQNPPIVSMHTAQLCQVLSVPIVASTITVAGLYVANGIQDNPRSCDEPQSNIFKWLACQLNPPQLPLPHRESHIQSFKWLEYPTDYVPPKMDLLIDDKTPFGFISPPTCPIDSEHLERSFDLLRYQHAFKELGVPSVITHETRIVSHKTGSSASSVTSHNIPPRVLRSPLDEGEAPLPTHLPAKEDDASSSSFRSSRWDIPWRILLFLGVCCAALLYPNRTQLSRKLFRTATPFKVLDETTVEIGNNHDPDTTTTARIVDKFLRPNVLPFQDLFNKPLYDALLRRFYPLPGKSFKLFALLNPAAYHSIFTATNPLQRHLEIIKKIRDEIPRHLTVVETAHVEESPESGSPLDVSDNRENGFNSFSMVESTHVEESAPVSDSHIDEASNEGGENPDSLSLVDIVTVTESAIDTTTPVSTEALRDLEISKKNLDTIIEAQIKRAECSPANVHSHLQQPNAINRSLSESMWASSTSSSLNRSDGLTPALQPWHFVQTTSSETGLQDNQAPGRRRRFRPRGRRRGHGQSQSEQDAPIEAETHSDIGPEVARPLFVTDLWS